MVEKIKPLDLDISKNQSWSVSQDVVYQIMRWLPTAILDDPQERKEEVINNHNTCIFELIPSFYN